MSEVTLGKAIPEFSADSTDGTVDNARLKGKWTVLYFYPKDSTPGCTTQAQNFRDQIDEFEALDCQIIGVSRDSLKSHGNFTNKQSLPFPLISDPEEKLCEMFGVMKLKNMYGKQVRGIERSTFLINPDGLLAHEWRGLKVPGHVDQVLQAVKDAS
ncbi:MAG: peroxiredoxin [Pusillimonas sp.]|nr:peroxiredoxin [Pusillimonas sp.]MBC43255.1 peroxiredoxin [Pusillimonas sp.]HCP78577.1 peroxiredoxin [Pusillimonas sp.]|tara:strand:+ start:41462 stop:41929 length:468 start_codon:yes stop_codon:yes gene_type:complete